MATTSEDLHFPTFEAAEAARALVLDSAKPGYSEVYVSPIHEAPLEPARPNLNRFSFNYIKYSG